MKKMLFLFLSVLLVFNLMSCQDSGSDDGGSSGKASAKNDEPEQEYSSVGIYIIPDNTLEQKCTIDYRLISTEYVGLMTTADGTEEVIRHPATEAKDVFYEKLPLWVLNDSLTYTNHLKEYMVKYNLRTYRDEYSFSNYDSRVVNLKKDTFTCIIFHGLDEPVIKTFLTKKEMSDFVDSFKS